MGGRLDAAGVGHAMQIFARTVTDAPHLSELEAFAFSGQAVMWVAVAPWVVGQHLGKGRLQGVIASRGFVMGAVQHFGAGIFGVTDAGMKRASFEGGGFLR